MITKNDCLSILVNLEDQKNLNVDPYVKKLVVAKEIPLEVLQFITKNRGIEVCNFYEILRKKHNKNKSPLYTNIIGELDDPIEIVTTLSSLLTQIILHGKHLANTETFYKEARAEEISRALNMYFSSASIDTCVTLLKLVKSDILVLEYLEGRRELKN